MSSTRSELIQQLRHNSQLRSTEEIQAFLKAVDELSKLEPKPDSIKKLFSVLDDKVVHPGPYDALLRHIYKTYNEEEIVSSLVEITPELQNRSKDRLVFVYLAILGSPSARTILRRYYLDRGDLQPSIYEQLLYTEMQITDVPELRADVSFVLGLEN